MNGCGNNNIGNILDAVSLILAFQNLLENRQQSAYNDVHKANDEQADTLLREINAKFEAQSKALDNLQTDIMHTRKICRELELQAGLVFGKLEKLLDAIGEGENRDT